MGENEMFAQCGYFNVYIINLNVTTLISIVQSESNGVDSLAEFAF
jgi:hypothetical protein